MLRWDRALQACKSLRLASFLQRSSSLQTMQELRSLALVGRGMCCPLLLLLLLSLLFDLLDEEL